MEAFARRLPQTLYFLSAPLLTYPFLHTLIQFSKCPVITQMGPGRETLSGTMRATIGGIQVPIPLRAHGPGKALSPTAEETTNITGTTIAAIPR